MNQLLVVFLATGTPLFGLAVHEMQSRLERWAQERHAQD
jgi:hypothetical protein